ncbi:hypothetical protein ACNHUS_26045 [Actinomycetes bacterium M1A6_2h]
MYIKTTSRQPPTIHEPEDCHRLSIVASAGQLPSAVVDSLVSAQLAKATSTSDDIRLDVSVLRNLARAAHSATRAPEWEADFAEMLDYAQSKGWYDTENNTVAAHIEWEDSAE